jgi:general secretion pathway protein G
MRRRAREQNIFFPWERARGALRLSGLSRARPAIAAGLMVLLLLLLGARERRLVGIRSTRATLGVVSSALDAYRADHQHKCPTVLTALVDEGYLGMKPVDAWGHPLRLVCPGRRDALGYDLSSDGPDGIMGGLDRVE